MDEEEYSPPPSPSPAPRLRRSPKRQALHERTDSHTNQILSPTIRPVTDSDAKVYATRPFPTQESQVFLPPGRLGAVDQSLLVAPLQPRRPPVRPSEVESNTNHATFATPKVRDDSHTGAPFKYAPASPASAFSSHNGPRLVPTSAHRRPLSYPPGEVHEETSIYSPSFGIDVDRLAMVEGSNVNNDRLGVPSHLPLRTPFSHAGRHGSSQSSPFTPQTSSTGNRSGLGAIASVASDLSFQSTPMSVGSAASSGTVIRKRGFTGPTPPGFYSLFPPVPSPSVESRYGSTRSRRSSSAPPRPVSEGPLSPLTAGSQSPVSPVSPDDSPSSSPRHRRSRSESLLDTVREYRQYPIVQFPSGSIDSTSTRSGSDEPPSPGHLIPRKPVTRSNAVRWNSYMSTIPSESEPDTRSSVANRSSANRSSAATRTDFGESSSRVREQMRRSSSALPAAFEPDSMPETSPEFSRLQGPFPLPDPLFSHKPSPRKRVTSGGSTIRIVSGDSVRDFATMPSVPPRDPRRLGSPTSIYSRPDYRDSGSQTEAGTQTNQRGSFIREGIPAWARYSPNFSTGHLPQAHDSYNSSYYEPVSGSYSHFNLNFGSLITCPNCSARWSPDNVPNLNQPNSNQLNRQPSRKGVAFADDVVDADNAKRFYYKNERRNRETIGRPLSVVSSSSSRRHTMGSLYPDSIQVARNRPQNGQQTPPPEVPRPQSFLARLRGEPVYAPPERPISMPITPATPIDRSVFVGEEIRYPTRNRDSANWSPHLWYSRASAMKRRTLFLAPSIDETAEGNGLTKRNIQVWCFALGFVLPISTFSHLPIDFTSAPTNSKQSGWPPPSCRCRQNPEPRPPRRHSNTTLRKHSARWTRRDTRTRAGGATLTASCLLLALASLLLL